MLYMFFTKKIQFIISLLCCLALSAAAQSILPPVIEWKGKSELLIASTANPWITPTERSGFITTPGYDETMNWFKKLAIASPLISMISIGKSAEGRDVFMV